jgi:ferredoxin
MTVMKTLFFSATGNNLYLAKRIGGEYYSIPKLLKEGQFEFEDDKIGIVFPIYQLGIPSIVEEFLKKVKIKSNYVYGVISYGKFSGSAVSQLLEIGKKNGIEFSYIKTIIMVDNYLPVFDMKKQIENEPKKNVEKNLAKIVQEINAQTKNIPQDSIIKKFITKCYRAFVDNSMIFDKNFRIEETCNGCSICTKVCPVDNIELINKKPVYKGKCIKCLACTHHCPNNAIRLKGEKSKARFINQNVTLKEIINAND